jgi:hypothetical protein
MTKRRKISEIYNDMNEINKRKPTDKELDELAEILNEIEDSCENDEDFHFEKIAKAHVKKGIFLATNRYPISRL